eukprot:3254251-Amphidinium_carterae.1
MCRQSSQQTELQRRYATLAPAPSCALREGQGHRLQSGTSRGGPGFGHGLVVMVECGGHTHKTRRKLARACRPALRFHNAATHRQVLVVLYPTLSPFCGLAGVSVSDLEGDCQVVCTWGHSRGKEKTTLSNTVVFH